MDEAIVKRIMPNSPQAEQAVIGSMLMDNEAVQNAMEMLTKEDFYTGKYGILFEAICQLAREGKPADIVLVQERVKQNGAPPEVAGMDSIREIMSMTGTSANVKHYAKEVHDKAIMRKLIRAAQKVEADCYEGKEAVSDILVNAEKNITTITQTGGDGELEPIADVTMRVLEEVQAASKVGGKITGIATGFTDLDYNMAGLQNSNLIIIAARPAMGKTAFVLNMADYISVKNNTTTAIFSLEMSREELVKRILSMESKVDSKNLKTGNLTNAEWAALAEGGSYVGDSKIWIDDTPGISINELKSRCRQLKRDHNLGLVMIDYIQLMTGNGRSESRQQEVSEISRSLKGLARELNIPVIALSQLSRKVEERDNKRPMLSDLRESGAIEQDADVIMFIYREDYYNKDVERKNVAEIIIAKQRSGAIGTIELAWMPELTKFANLEGARKVQHDE